MPVIKMTLRDRAYDALSNGFAWSTMLENDELREIVAELRSMAGRHFFEESTAYSLMADAIQCLIDDEEHDDEGQAR